MSNKFKVGDKVVVKAGQEGGVRSKYDVEAGKTYTVTSINGTGCLRFAEKATPWGLDRYPPAHDPARFELAQQPGHKFKVGDRVRLLESVCSGLLIPGQVYTVRALRGSPHSTPKGVYLEGFSNYDWWFEHRFELVPEVPREYRLSRNGSIAASRHRTTEAAAEAARSLYNDGVEFDIVEVVTVSKHTVRKVVEVRQ
ncbi:hypothetical protein ACI2US_03065 [Ralstonia nicotianae]